MTTKSPAAELRRLRRNLGEEQARVAQLTFELAERRRVGETLSRIASHTQYFAALPGTSKDLERRLNEAIAEARKAWDAIRRVE